MGRRSARKDGPMKCFFLPDDTVSVFPVDEELKELTVPIELQLSHGSVIKGVIP
jgi:hypothetical protein